MKQTLNVVAGVTVSLMVMLTDFRKLTKYSLIFLFIGLITLLVLNLLLSFTIYEVNPNNKPILSGQIVMPSLIIFWASYLSKEKQKLLFLLTVFIVTMFLFLNISSFTTSIMYSVIVLSLFFGSKINRKIIFRTVSTGSMLLVIYILGFWVTAAENQKGRFYAFLHPENYSRSGGYWYIKIKDLISDAGLFGNSTKVNYVNMTTDFAYVNITYSYGWLFGGLLLVLLAVLLAKILGISVRVKNLFGKQLLLGVFTVLFFQLVYNIGMILGFLPRISMSLPFIGYGFLPTLFNSILIGMVLSVYRYKDIPEFC